MLLEWEINRVGDANDRSVRIVLNDSLDESQESFFVRRETIDFVDH